MAKKKKSKPRRNRPTEPMASTPVSSDGHSGGGWHAARETIESIVIAFVLAFLFRTFEAEAFVIPTGSMSPALQGQHKDVCCSECGYRFRTTASSEGDGRQRMIARQRNQRLRFGAYQDDFSGLDVLAGVCPMCRQTMAFRTDLPQGVPSYINLKEVEQETSYPGDRILVNKYCYLNKDPDRWDVVVFKFPGNGEMNYIKRLVGLPGEQLQLYQGDVFARLLGEESEFSIQRKPPEKQQAMFQTVHDTDFESATLYGAGWPLRWAPVAPVETASKGWQVDAKIEGQTVEQRYQVASDKADPIAWLRYRHLLPTTHDWTVARRFSTSGEYQGTTKDQWLGAIRPQLIRDFNAYNAQLERRQVRAAGWKLPEKSLGMHWVGDLAIRCEVDIEKPEGELLLDLVEAGKHFACKIDLTSGQATLTIDGFESFAPVATTSIVKSGNYELLFANVDDQLLLWVDDQLIDFGDTRYDPEQIFGDREKMIPQTSEEEPGDLAPVGIGARGASLTVERLEVMRDIYYVATSWRDGPSFNDYSPVRQATMLADGTRMPALQNEKQLFSDPAAWPRLLDRQKRNFDIKKDQFFVMGDNSPASLDCRLWMSNGSTSGIPGGPYLDRRLLTGKAVCVFWPHSWGSIPGIQQLPGFPNFGDMRIVR